jgi:hypothetical protein
MHINYYTGGETAATQLRDAATINLFAPAQNTEPFKVGGSGVPPSWVDDIRIYDQVLTAPQIEAIRLENLPEPSGGILLLTLSLEALCRRSRRGWRGFPVLSDASRDIYWR